MLPLLDQLEAAALAELGAADGAALESWRQAYLGPSGRLKAAMAGLKDVPKEQRPAVGQRLNALKGTLEGAFEARKAAVGERPGTPAGQGAIDLTEPGLIDSKELGRRHIITRVRAELVEVFA